jgi:hypothetical protein
MLSLWLLCSFSLSREKEGGVIGLRGRPDRQMLKKTFPTICLTEKVRLWEQEKGLTKWVHTLSSSSPQSPAKSVYHKHSLRMGWRNFFSSCAVVSVFWFLAGNMFWFYILMYLCTGFSQNTYAEDTSGYIVGTYIISD